MNIDEQKFAWYGIDTKKDLNLSAICNRPFGTVLVDKLGDVYLCDCQAWLPAPVGNLHEHSLEQIFENENAEEIRETMLDGSYKYCNTKQCIFLNSEFIQRQATLVPPVELVTIRLGIDESCNLRCPSCRTEMIYDTDRDSLKKKFRIADKIIDYLNEDDNGLNIIIGSDGDPFASLVYRYLMKHAPNKGSVRYSIQTNGLLIKKMMSRFLNVFNNLQMLQVSIDGATKDTYEKIRLGGKWEKIKENMEHISKVKDQYHFLWHFDFVVQRDNFREIPMLLEWADRLGVDAVNLKPIEDWNTYTDIKQYQVWKKDHPDYDEYNSIMNSVKDHPKIAHRNFHWTLT